MTLSITRSEFKTRQNSKKNPKKSIFVSVFVLQNNLFKVTLDVAPELEM